MQLISRRVFLAGSALAATVGTGRSAGRPLGPMAEPGQGARVPVTLDAAERKGSLPCLNGAQVPFWTFAGELPVIRMQLGDLVQAKLVNNLPRPGEHTSIHWHGIRLPQAQDGVPYLSQVPVAPGASFDYEFTPPDTGSFFFHTHCNTIEQLGRGLAGLLIVEGDETEAYDDELVLVSRDWRIENGAFQPFLTDKGAANAGDFGAIRSVNGATSPDINVKSSADIRVRLYNIDPTRILEIGLVGGDAAVIAVDGISVTPFPLTSWRLGPAMRLDLVIRTAAAGDAVTLYDYKVAEPFVLARLVSSGEPVRTAAFDPAPLRQNRIPVPDLASAESLRFEFSSSAGGAAVASLSEAFPGIDDLCLADKTFWAINKQSWPADGHRNLPAPLAMLQLGKSYRFELSNISKQFHPIHIHGHSFTVLKSTRTDFPVHHADTVLLAPRETVEVAFVADNPGDWMFHCHLIGHQETGMMGYLRIV